MKYQDKIYGQFEINEPVVLELFRSQSLQRLKGIRPTAVNYYFDSRLNHSRFEHSVGVYYLLNHFKASLEEQVAGLLHDVSHQVFSHVMDFLHESGPAQDHQDSIHHTLFETGELREILQSHNLSPQEISNLGNWKMLDNELPDICADRLDYTLRDAFQVSLIDLKTVWDILDDLFYDQNKGFVFKNMETALKFGRLSLTMQTNIWHSYASEVSFRLMSEILKYASAKNYITEDDLWLTDDEMVKKLLSFKNDFINDKWAELISLSLDKTKPCPISKFRAVDPWIGDKRLSEIDNDFKEKFEAVRAKISSR
jgi:hypothetical protein